MANVSPATPTYSDPLDWRGGEVVTTEKFGNLLGLINHLMEQQGSAVAYSASFPDDVLFWDGDEPDDPQLSIVIPEISDLHDSLTIRLKLSEDGASGTKTVRFYSQGADASVSVNPVAGGAETWAEVTLATEALDGEAFDLVDVYLSTSGDGVSVHNISIEYDAPDTLDEVFTSQAADPDNTGSLTDYTGWLFGSDASGADYPLTAGRAKAVIGVLGYLVRRPRIYQNWSAIRGLGAGLYRLPSVGVRSWPIDIFGAVRAHLDIQVAATIYETLGAIGEHDVQIGSTGVRFAADSEDVDVESIRPAAFGHENYVHPAGGLVPFRYELTVRGSEATPEPADAKFSRIAIWGP